MNILLGNTYWVNFIDPNYPCNCPCHTNEMVRHVVPCCYDRSYSGPALCIGLLENDIYAFAISNIRILLLTKGSVIEQYNKPMKIKLQFLRALINLLKQKENCVEVMTIL